MGLLSCATRLTFGVPIEPEASELPKGLMLGRDGNIHIRITSLDDVGSYMMNGCRVIGAIVCGPNGDLVGALSMHAPSLISVLALELHTIKKGLELALYLGCVPLIVESDR
ncbi:unnamed protein product [Malus baccata var. baccata]